MKRFEVTVPVSCLVNINVMAENEQDAIDTAIEIINEAEVEVFDDLFDFQAHNELYEHAHSSVSLSIEKAEAYG